MKVAVLSDVHANLPALEAVLAAADAAGAEAVWCLGDVVDYGPHPAACLELVRASCERVVAGNHDLAVAGMVGLAEFSEVARRCVTWSLTQLAEAQLEWLATLPLEVTVGQEQVGLWHASPRDPVWEYVTGKVTASACFSAVPHRLVLVGHTHLPAAYRLRADLAAYGPTGSDTRRRTRNVHLRGPQETLDLGADRLLVNPGSVGFPRAERDRRAQWGLLDLGAGSFSFRRTDYDRQRTRADLLATGLLAELAAWV